MRWLLHALAVIVLTLLTQIGGAAYLLALVVARGGLRRVGAFVVLYAGLSIAMPFVAPATGRVALPCTGEPLRMQSVLYCALNRHYVTRDVAQYAHALAEHMGAAYPGTVTLALDANFPFLDGFPLLPHLSHDDGDKLDFAFYYTDEAGTYLPGETASPIGYWAFEPPGPGARTPCDGRGTPLSLRWDMGWIAPWMRPLSIDDARVAEAVRWLARNAPAGYRPKILLEPHLTDRLGVAHRAVRFQGCRAARHDDHIHVQLDRTGG